MDIDRETACVRRESDMREIEARERLDSINAVGGALGESVATPCVLILKTASTPPAPNRGAGALKPASEKTATEGQGESSAPDISVLLVGNNLQITANVDAAGLLKLKDVLNKYEEILKLLQ